jgi:polyisoprenoid-binding protein YceI
MKKYLVVTIATLATLLSYAQMFTPTDVGSSVKFSIKNFGITANGSFTGLSGVVKFDPAYPDLAKLEVTVDAATVKTGIDARDSHLKKEDYFDVKTYPRLSFVSTGVTKSATGYFINGLITIKGITKPVAFPFDAVMRNNGYVLTGEFKLNRRDFKLGGSSLVLSDNLNVKLSVFCRRS